MAEKDNRSDRQKLIDGLEDLGPDHPHLKYLQKLHELFSESELGQEILEIWIKGYLHEPSIKSDNEPDWHIYVREGENRFVRSIMANIQRHLLYVEKYSGGK